ncbi:hypothetical protein [Anatilimnocola floriformis]|uniref:hypothetical protein n=1 Tax=Anatilimnocola floriformis TaxID=2948575 RepID=UPI0020C40C97|nr:hypothetical protein [Anatilimnocola floriformis]
MSDLTMYDPQPIPPQQQRFRWTFSLGTLLMLMLGVGIALAWWLDRQQFNARLRKIEQMYEPQVQTAWGAVEILGKPDDASGLMGKSWCPQTASAADWIEVTYDQAVAATSIDIYETYSPGYVTEVLVTDGNGTVTSIWKGTDPLKPPPAIPALGPAISEPTPELTPEPPAADTDPTTVGPTTSIPPTLAPVPRTGVFNVAILPSIKSVQRVTIHVDTTGQNVWPCIDAVALKTATGDVWPTRAACSSVYGGGSLSATNKKGGWASWW